MDKEKEIEEIADICWQNRRKWSNHRQGFCYSQATALYNAGYGKVKQAISEFAEYAKQVIVKQFSDTEIEKIKTVGALQLLYNKIEELYGVDE